MSNPAPSGSPGISHSNVYGMKTEGNSVIITFNVGKYHSGAATDRQRGPPSNQSEPEPKKYMGGNIPSRSFRMLQAMTALDPNGETNMYSAQ